MRRIEFRAWDGTTMHYLENGRVIGNIYEQPEIEKPRWEDPND